MRGSSATPMGSVLWRPTVTQEPASNVAASGSRTPAAMPLPRLLAIPFLHHVQRRRQYITWIHPLGTLMRHDLRRRCRCRRLQTLSLAVAPGAPCVGEASRTPALVAPPGLEHGRPARLRAALAPAVPPPTVARAAHDHLGLAACANKYSGADALAHEPAQRACSSHRRSGSSRKRAAKQSDSPAPSIGRLRRAPVQYFARTRGFHGGARQSEQLPRRSGCRARSTSCRVLPRQGAVVHPRRGVWGYPRLHP